MTFAFLPSKKIAALRAMPELDFLPNRNLRPGTWCWPNRIHYSHSTSVFLTGFKPAGLTPKSCWFLFGRAGIGIVGVMLTRCPMFHLPVFNSGQVGTSPCNRTGKSVVKMSPILYGFTTIKVDN